MIIELRLGNIFKNVSQLKVLEFSNFLVGSPKYCLQLGDALSTNLASFLSYDSRSPKNKKKLRTIGPLRIVWCGKKIPSIEIFLQLLFSTGLCVICNVENIRCK